MVIEEQPAFVLHTRKYTDSRVIVELLTKDYGRVSGVYRKPKKGIALQGFMPLLVNWQGKSALKTLTHIEASDQATLLQGRALYCAFYLNELLVRALPQDDPSNSVFDLYTSTLSEIALIVPLPDGEFPSVELEQCLRQFEFSLLEELGLGFNFYEDANQEPIESNDATFYRFKDDSGFFRTGIKDGVSIPANVLVAIRERNWRTEEQTLRYAKILCRTALRRVIGDKPLKSRELFAPVKPK